MRIAIVLAGLTALTACDPAAEQTAFAVPITAREGAIEVTRGTGPPDADPASCYASESSPAVIETVTEQLMLQPPQVASDGSVREPAVFLTETRQRIVEERRILWFEVPCQLQHDDPAFIASLQRALSARGLYDGPDNGIMTRRTLRAVRAFQEPQGLDSAILSLAAARQLGLALWNPELAAGGDSG